MMLRKLCPWALAVCVLTGCPSSDDPAASAANGGSGAGAVPPDGEGDDGRGGEGAGDGGEGAQGAGEGGNGDGGSGANDDTDGDRPFPGNGISAIVDGTRVTNEEVFLLPNNTGNGVAMFEAGSGLEKWRLFVPGVPGTYSCDDGVETAVLQLIHATDLARAGVASGRGSCTVTLSVAKDGLYSGTFQGVLEAASGDGALLGVDDGYFHYDPYRQPGDDEGIVPGEPGGTFTLDGQMWSYPAVSLLPFETYAAINLQPASSDTMAPGFPLGIQLHSIPNEPGTYACGEGASYRGLNVWFWWEGAWYYAGNRQAQDPSGPEGSECTITLTQVGVIDGFTYSGTLAGTFSGTFVTGDGSKSVEVTNGSFLGIGQ